MKLDTGTFSKNLLGLKFMQKAKQQIEQKAEKEQLSQDNSKQQYIIHQSYYSCERLKLGRLSFKGMNPEIEILMRSDDDRCHDEIDK